MTVCFISVVRPLKLFPRATFAVGYGATQNKLFGVIRVSGPSRVRGRSGRGVVDASLVIHFTIMSGTS
jgi:hypothetical protein